MRNHAKALLSVGALASIALSLTACSSGDAAGGEGDSGEGAVLKHCVALSYEPLEYYENGTSGKVIGWDVEGAEQVGEVLGMKTETTVMDFDGLIPALQSGKCDLAWSGMYVNEERAQVADPVPVLQTGTQVVLRTEIAKDVKEPLDLCGLKIAAQTGTEDEAHVQEVSAECVAEGEPAIEVTGYPGSVDAIPAIRSGKLDGLVDTTVLAATLGKKNDDLTPVAGLFPAEYWFGAYTNKGSELSPKVEDAIHQLIENGKLAELAEKYGLNPDDVAKVDTKAL